LSATEPSTATNLARYSLERILTHDKRNDRRDFVQFLEISTVSDCTIPEQIQPQGHRDNDEKQAQLNGDGQDQNYLIDSVDGQRCTYSLEGLPSKQLVRA